MITEQMVDNFNAIMQRFGSVVRLRRLETPFIAIEIDLASNKYIDSKVINITEEFCEMLYEYFRSYGIELTCNNTRNLFWSNNDLQS